MSKFCTSCGTPNNGSSFCISCGAAAAKTTTSTPATEVQEIKTPVSIETNELVSPEIVVAKKRRGLKIALTMGTIAAALVGSFFVGRTSVDLEKERKISYDLGVESGESSGYERGDSAGYSRGLTAGKREGCRGVFEFSDGTFDHVVPYNPYSSYNRYPGGYYTSLSNC